MSAESGHGHEKKGGHESHGASHSEWQRHAMNGLKAFGIGYATIAAAPALLAAAGVIVPAYLINWLGIGAAGFFLGGEYGGGSAPKAAGAHH